MLDYSSPVACSLSGSQPPGVGPWLWKFTYQIFLHVSVYNDRVSNSFKIGQESWVQGIALRHLDLTVPIVAFRSILDVHLIRDNHVDACFMRKILIVIYIHVPIKYHDGLSIRNPSYFGFRNTGEGSSNAAPGHSKNEKAVVEERGGHDTTVVTRDGHVLG